jgi:predicted RNA binding protein YcfA (HicA-like mRNA interferase family)
MKQISGKELARLVERRGWILLRVNGSIVRLSIPIHANRPLKLGLLRSLLKHADLKEADL